MNAQTYFLRLLKCSLLVILSAVFMVGCSPESAPEVDEVAQVVETPTNTPTPEPTSTATNTPQPTSTFTPSPTPTDTATPTDTPTPTPTPFAGGGYLAFSSVRLGSRYANPNSDIVLLNPSTGQMDWLTRDHIGATRGFPSWSPDGRELVYTVDNMLYTYNLDEGSEKELESPFGATMFHPSWSQEGEILALYAPDGHYPQIWIATAHQSDWRAITPDISFQFDPVWSPDGRHYAFSGAPGEIYKDWIDLVFFGFNFGGIALTFTDVQPRDIFIVDAESGEQVRVNATQADDFHPSWSPDGSKLAFVSVVELENTEIFVVDKDGSNLTRLTSNKEEDLFPTWSPDGNMVAFSSNRGGDYDIYVSPAGGGEAVALTDNLVDDLQPVWSPNPMSPVDSLGPVGAMDTAGYQPAQMTMEEVVDWLYMQGLITSKAGRTVKIKDYLRQWAQIGWFSWFPTGQSVKNFVLRADASWASASDKADWFNSGCGFVFREQDNNNFYMARVAMDGIASIKKWRAGNGSWVGRSVDKYPFEIPEDGANIMLVADGNDMMLFVNGLMLLRQSDGTFESGSLGLTIFSGTNKGFGTRCEMENIELYKLNK